MQLPAPRTLLLATLAALACSSAAPQAHDVVGDASDGLVYVRQTGAASHLWRARLSDGATRPLFASDRHTDTWPYWAEATRRLIFQREPVPHGAADLWIWQPGDAEPSPLLATPDRDERWPEWSPDGTRVTFAWRGRAAPVSGIGWIEIPSGREHAAAVSGSRDFFFRPSFAPDSQRLVAQRRDGAGADSARGSTIWLVDARGPRRLTTDDGWFEQKPFFTRDGAWVVFARQRGNGPREVALVAAGADVGGGSAATPLRAGAPDADEHSARPSPSRDELAFVSGRSGNRDIWLASFPDGPARNLTATAERDEFAPRWSPDGQRLVVTATRPQPPGREGDRIAGIETMLVVLDREGRVLLETPGMMADWMPPF